MKKPGDIMKPAMYYYWSKRMAGFSPNERLRLLVGKISLEELERYPGYVGKVHESNLVHIFQF